MEKVRGKSPRRQARTEGPPRTRAGITVLPLRDKAEKIKEE
jgi:hypothetical protein